jgi:hypothetical protein
MARITLPLLALLVSAASAQAACYADYKAKRDNPLQLAYGVSEIHGACDPASAYAELAPRLAAGGWQLLEVVSVFDEAGLEERRGNAGQFYLLY